MPECGRCGFVAGDAFHLMRHLKRQTPCVATESAPTAQELLEKQEGERKAARTRTLPCAFCNKLFASRSSRSHHKRMCPERPVPDAESLQLQIDQLREHIASHLASPVTVYATTNNITVLPFGQENDAHLRDADFLLQCLRRTNAGVMQFLEKKHFSPQHPENHNLMATNAKMPYVKICREGGRWELADKNAVIDDSVVQACNTLLDFFDDNGYADSSRPSVDSFVTMLKDNDGLDKFAKQSRKDVFLMIVNGTKKLNLRAC
jgi:hypothetical protein